MFLFIIGFIAMIGGVCCMDSTDATLPLSICLCGVILMFVGLCEKDNRED